MVRDLEISNKGKDPIDGINRVLVEVKNYGTAKDITLDNLIIHDVYGILVRENLGGGNAILLRNKLADDTVSQPSRFDGLVVQNCTIRNCQRNGIMMDLNPIRVPLTNISGIQNQMRTGQPFYGLSATKR